MIGTVSFGGYITQNNQNEGMLKVQNEFTIKVIDSLNYPFYVINIKDHTIALANAAGAAKGDGMTCHAVSHKNVIPCGSKEHPCPLEEVVKTKKPVIVEHIHYDWDGNPRNVEVHCYPIFDIEGNVIQVIEYSFDITERKKNEDILQTSLLLSEYSFSHTLDDLIKKTLDEAEILTRSQIGFLHFLEKDQKTLILQNWSTNTLLKMCTSEGKGKHYPIDEAGVWVDAVHQRRPVIHNDYARLTHKKGLPPGHAPIIRELVIPIIRGGLVLGILGVGNKPSGYDAKDIEIVSRLTNLIWDILVSKRAEEKVHEASRYTRSLIEASLDPLVTINPEGKITDVNKATETVIGISHEKLIGSNFSDYFTEPENAKVGYQQVLEKGFVKDYPLAIKHVSDKSTDVLFNATIYKNDAGEVQGIFAAARDVTELKRMEKERIEILNREHTAIAETQAARKLDQLKSMFIASTSHELRTPLNSIIGFSSLLLGGFSGELNPEQKRQLDIVRSAGNHLLLLISDVIDVSKIEAGKIDLKVSQVEFRQIVDEVVLTLGANLMEKRLQLIVEVEDITLKTDKRRLLQCIFNLVGNAIKYTEKGSIKIAAKKIENRINISVTDTGIGIKKEDIPKLFGSFIRLQTPLTAKTQGTGLGLYLVKKLAKDFLGGDVEVESEFGVGSKFTLNIPIELEEKGLVFLC